MQKWDDREVADWLMYARKYAKLVQYYSLDNQPDGDWKLFIEKDISTLVAIVARHDVERVQREWNEAMHELDCAQTPEKIKEAVGMLLACLYEMADTLATWQRNAVPELSLRKTLDRLCASVIDTGFGRLLNFLKEAEALDVPLVGKDKKPLDLRRAANSWPKINANGVKLFPLGEPEVKKREIAELKEKLRALFKAFMEVTHVLVKQAPTFLEETFTSFPRHEPHMALFLAFLN